MSRGAAAVRLLRQSVRQQDDSQVPSQVSTVKLGERKAGSYIIR